MAGFRKAKDTQAALKLGVYGSAGDGKTFTSCLVAEGLAKSQGKEVAFIDTEYGTAFYSKHVPERKIHPEGFDFDYLYSKSITEVLQEVKNLDATRYGVLVVDSATHLWESCKNAYTGRTTKIGGIPMQAWSQIKRPWKELINLLLSSPLHVIMCGREGAEYEQNEETGELKSVGYKMKAEGESSYEMHILVRLEGVRNSKGEKIPTAFIEKDRTGVLSGKVIPWPNFESLAKPILPLLSGSQAQVASEDEVAAKDAEEIERIQKEEMKKSSSMKTHYLRAFAACQTKEDVAKLAKQLTPELKKTLLKEDLDLVREAWEKANEATSK